jgi:hypothetical protein
MRAKFLANDINHFNKVLNLKVSKYCFNILLVTEGIPFYIQARVKGEMSCMANTTKSIMLEMAHLKH